MLERIKAIIEAEAAAVRSIPIDASFEKAVAIIHRQVHEKGGKLVTSGMGKAGQIAHNIATTFSSTGTPAAYLHPSEAQHGDLGILQPNDVMLVISNSGKTREIVELIAENPDFDPNIVDTRERSVEIEGIAVGLIRGGEAM